jgi:hypothetical protein
MAIQDVLAQQLEFDRATLAQLSDRGDRADIERAVEHHFVAEEQVPLVMLAEYAHGLLFEPSEISQREHEGVQYWVLDLVSRTRLDDGRVSREAALMKFLAISREGCRLTPGRWADET